MGLFLVDIRIQMKWAHSHHPRALWRKDELTVLRRPVKTVLLAAHLESLTNEAWQQ
jgi:hypothetical protein